MRAIKMQKPVFWQHKAAPGSWNSGILEDLIFSVNESSISKTAWVYIRIVVQCVLFIPLLALLVTYYHAHFSIVAVSCLAFFTNIIACLDRPARALTSIVAFCVIDAFVLVIFLI
ncbi:hypothetical protein [Mucilaginibacter gotjawali]|uniref:Uncharacterized protein n=2 Tax=Mucilaginibacter gotjawali TaxID=1550579 RepID=A0A110B2L1_9SPHI|nr:hypothetical protein [Mucilaginibacter gotjawali]MBB3058775.1 hypothetical protein [Mucilaginibacter gotjawali]BAU53846.1 hypothetical protein MgSA37_02017 [Mucilaginibacter gotjawali]